MSRSRQSKIERLRKAERERERETQGMAKRKRLPASAWKVPAPFAAIPFAVFQSQAFLTLSFTAKLVLLYVIAEMKAPESSNGCIVFSRAVAKRHGLNSEDGRPTALRELTDRDLLLVTRQGHGGRATWYALPWFPLIAPDPKRGQVGSYDAPYSPTVAAPFATSEAWRTWAPDPETCTVGRCKKQSDRTGRRCIDSSPDGASAPNPAPADGANSPASINLRVSPPVYSGAGGSGGAGAADAAPVPALSAEVLVLTRRGSR